MCLRTLFKRLLGVSLLLLIFSIRARVPAGAVLKDYVGSSVLPYPLAWIENKGQIPDSSVLFYTFTKSYMVAITKEEIRYYVPTSDGFKVAREEVLFREKTGSEQPFNFSIEPVSETKTKIHYFRGKHGLEVYHPRTYRRLVLRNLREGVTLILEVFPEGVERIIKAKNIEGLESLRFSYKGVEKLEIKGDSLTLRLGNSELALEPPRVLGDSSEIKVNYRPEGLAWSLHVDACSDISSREIIVDPLLYGSFISSAHGWHYDECHDVKVAPDGYVYVVGKTSFPSAFSSSFNATSIGSCGWADVFICKFSPDMKTLISSALLGGSDYEQEPILLGGITEDGRVFVGGCTKSSDFPVTPGAFNTTYNNDTEAFLSVLDSSLSTLIASTYIGGNGCDGIDAIYLDSEREEVVVGGYTSSSDFPIGTGGYNTTPNDIYILILDFNLTHRIAGTFIGGNDTDGLYGVARAEDGTIYICGYTLSKDFPLTPGALDTENPNDKTEGFVCRFNANLSTLLSSTLLGGSDWDRATAIRVAPPGTPYEGNVYVGGYTLSYDFPMNVTGGYQENIVNSFGDAYVVILNPELNEMLRGTFLGGSGVEYLANMVLSPNGDVVISLSTGSSDLPLLPFSYAKVQQNIALARLSADLSSLEGLTYLGGAESEYMEYGGGLDVTPSGEILVAGETDCATDFPLTTTALNDTFASNAASAGFVCMFDPDLSWIRAPSDLEANSTTSSVLLTWHDNTKYEEGFCLYKGNMTGFEMNATTLMANLTANTITFEDSNVTEGRTYCYKVVAFYDNQTSEPSNEAFLFYIKAPTDLKATMDGDFVKLTWKDNSNIEEFYYIYRGTSPGFTPGPSNRIGVAGPNTEVFWDESLSKSGIYYYRVAAAVGEHRALSNEAEIHAEIFASEQEGEEEVIVTGNVVERDGHFGVYARVDAEVRIYSLKGTFVDSFNVKAKQHVLYGNELSYGLYFLVIKTRTGHTYVRKILVKEYK